MNSKLKRKRWLYCALVLVTIPLGLASRKFAPDLPAVIAENGGDVLAATCIFFGIRFLAIRPSLLKILWISYLVCIAIETSQLWKAPWLVHLRDHTPMGILLGHEFIWSDWIRYAVGVMIGFLIGVLAEGLLSRERNAD
jgi:hypothetical protein